MLHYPAIDPVIFSLGPLKVHWYGAMYLLGFVAAWWVGTRRARQPWSPFTPQQIEDLVFYAAIGVVLGGRFGYVFFYGFEQFLLEPLWLFKVWEGGMSFHGGLLGVFAALVLYARKTGVALSGACDFVAPMAPLGLGFGRLANFINAELYGRASDAPWAMVFPTDPLRLARHPSQLYQFALEGIVLFLVVLIYSRKPRPSGAVTGLFLVVYGLGRFCVEFFREPDVGIGFDFFGWMTRGQGLSLPMVAAGVILMVWAYSHRQLTDSAAGLQVPPARGGREAQSAKIARSGAPKNGARKRAQKKSRGRRH